MFGKPCEQFRTTSSETYANYFRTEFANRNFKLPGVLSSSSRTSSRTFRNFPEFPQNFPEFPGISRKFPEFNKLFSSRTVRNCSRTGSELIANSEFGSVRVAFRTSCSRTVRELFARVRELVRELGSRTQNPEKLERVTKCVSGKALRWECGVARLRGVAVARPKTRTRNEMDSDFFGPKTWPGPRCSWRLDPRGPVVWPKPRTRNDTSCFWTVYTKGLRPLLYPVFDVIPHR